MKILKFELKRAIKNRLFAISLSIGIIICIFDIVVYYITFKNDNNRIVIQAWIGTDYVFAFNSVFYTLLPLIACLPYGGSLFYDINSGYEKNILIKTSRRSYCVSKIIVSFLLGMLVVIIPLLFDLFICAGLYPNGLPEKLRFLTAGVIDCNMFAELFNLKPVTYIFVFIIVDGLFGGLFCLMSMSVTLWSKSSFTAVILPFAMYVMTSVLNQNQKGTSFSVMEIVNPSQRYITSFSALIYIFIGSLLFSLVITYISNIKREII